MSLRIGVDIGGTNLRVGVVDGLSIIDEIRREADFSSFCHSHPPEVAWRMILQTTTGALQEVLQRHEDVVSIGIGFPGFIDPVHGTVAQSPNLPGLRDVDLAGDLANRLQRVVMVENDALAAAYGEFKLLSEPASSLVYLGLGTGVGGGLIVNQQPFAGQHGYAMEVGHLIVEPEGRLCGCGNRGCMEQYASASGVAATFFEKSGQTLDAHDIAVLANGGNVDALQSFALAGATLAEALAHILKVVDVKLVIIGGGLSQAWPLMVEAFDRRLDHDLIPVLRDKVRVQISTSGDRAGIIGAALLSG